MGEVQTRRGVERPPSKPAYGLCRSWNWVSPILQRANNQLSPCITGSKRRNKKVSTYWHFFPKLFWPKDNSFHIRKITFNSKYATVAYLTHDIWKSITVSTRNSKILQFIAEESKISFRVISFDLEIKRNGSYMYFDISWWIQKFYVFLTIFKAQTN